MERAERKALKIKQATVYNDPHRTVQSGRQDADINVIVAHHKRTGEWRNVNPKTPKYGDFSAAFELEQALAVVARATEEFNSLPAKVRSLADNSPTKFLAMLASEEDVKVLKAAGLPTKSEGPRETPLTPPVGGEPTP